MLFTHLWWTRGRCPGTQCYFYLEKEEDRRREEKIRKDKRRENVTSIKLKGVFCSVFSSRTGQRVNSAETMEGLSNWRNQSKKKKLQCKDLQRHIHPRYLLWQMTSSGILGTRDSVNWISRKKENMHTHTNAQTCALIHTTMEQNELNLSYVAPMVPSISIRASVISHPSCLPSFNLLTTHPHSSCSWLIINVQYHVCMPTFVWSFECLWFCASIHVYFGVYPK